MSYILQIETATKNCSVALSQNGKTIQSRELAEAGYSHAEKLHVFISEVLQQAGIRFDQLDAVAVSKGPGSYTGLRIGVSAAKGLCYALGIPLIAIDTLTLLAQKLQIENGLIVPMLDARRMEVYSAVFDSQHQMVREVQAEILSETSFLAHSEIVHFLGDSNAKAKTVLTQSNFVFHDDLVYPSAADLSGLAFEKFTKGAFEDLAYFEPYYLKDFMITTRSSE